jgi:hypothetical protein
MRISRDHPLDQEAWPADVELIMSALEAAWAGDEHRTTTRRRLRVPAYAKLLAEMHTNRQVVVYTRDCGPRHVGFLTDAVLPLGYGLILTLKTPEGVLLEAAGVVHRCRECVPGWFEGSISLNRPVNELK